MTGLPRHPERRPLKGALAVGLRRVGRHPFVALGVYAILAMAAALSSWFPATILAAPLKGRPTPSPQDWAALGQLHHPILQTLGLGLAGLVLFWSLVVSPLLDAGILARFAHNESFASGLRRYGLRLIALRGITLALLIPFAVVTRYGLRGGHAAALAAADERWQVLAFIGPLMLLFPIALTFLALQQQAQAALVRRRTTLGEALLDAVVLLQGRSWAPPLLYAGATILRLTILGLGVLIATAHPSVTVAQIIAQVAIFGAVLIDLWRLGSALEIV
ncbi:MAG: hypothetical protein KAI47_13880 [Deltaproteobacteria bacterium]|nr:hypothetical protein [Deltaproteobacteria bacterium]